MMSIRILAPLVQEESTSESHIGPWGIRRHSKDAIRAMWLLSESCTASALMVELFCCVDPRASTLEFSGLRGL